VALTASDNEADKARCRDAGMSDFLTKPLTIDRVAGFLLDWRRRILVGVRT
jgi:CheY-like chemotaxis protein